MLTLACGCVQTQCENLVTALPGCTSGSLCLGDQIVPWPSFRCVRALSPPLEVHVPRNAAVCRHLGPAGPQYKCSVGYRYLEFLQRGGGGGGRGYGVCHACAVHCKLYLTCSALLYEEEFTWSHPWQGGAHPLNLSLGNSSFLYFIIPYEINAYVNALNRS